MFRKGLNEFISNCLQSGIPEKYPGKIEW